MGARVTAARREPAHPGALMREILVEHFGCTVAESARRMGVSRRALHAVLAGRSALTPEMALRFSYLTGAAPEIYLQMQGRRDLWRAERRRPRPVVTPLRDTRAR